MRKIQMHIVKTTPQNVDEPDNIITTFVALGTDFRAGWGLPIHANKIVSEEVAEVEVFEIGDRVSAELKRGTYQDEDGISSGGKWVKKTGIIESCHGINDTSGFVKFDDGDIQSISLIRGDDGYPGRNIQSVTRDESMVDPENLKNYTYETPEELQSMDKIDATTCREPYRRGIGQGFGDTEDGD